MVVDLHHIKIDEKKGVQPDLDSWCVNDGHFLFDSFVDFNEWIDGEDPFDLRTKYSLDNFSSPSKALFAGDKQAYIQEFKSYRNARYSEVLSEAYFIDNFAGDHWAERNRERFEQLVNCFLEDKVIPFIGAGISVSAGFPTWKDHLRQQGRTAGIDADHIKALLSKGEFENVIHEIETIRGRDVFVQEIRDVFSKTPKLDDLILRITELFDDTLITTNYDKTIETAFDTGKNEATQIISSNNALQKPSLTQTTIYKIHGGIDKPSECILGKNQYDAAYGVGLVDLNKPIPKLLSYHYRTSSLLFLGCSLNNDRTMQVFKQVKDQIGDTDRPQHFSIEQTPETEEELVNRNAYLAGYGITAIWFERGAYNLVENILRLLRHEVRYRRGAVITRIQSAEEPARLVQPVIEEKIGLFETLWKGFRKAVGL